MTQKTKFVTFLGILILILYSLHIVILQSYRTSNYQPYKRLSKIINGQVNADILITGSSRALVHFDCKIVENQNEPYSCFNIGLDGSLLNLQIPLLETYLEKNKAPKIIIQGLDINSFISRKNVYQPYQYFPYLYLNSIYNRLVTIDKSFWKYKNIPLYFVTTGQFLSDFLTNKTLTNSSTNTLGSRLQDKSWDNSFDKAKRNNPEGHTFEIEEEAVENLHYLINLAKRYKSKVVLVYTPEYYENFDLILNRSEIFQKFQKFSDYYDIPFWDFSNTSITKETRYFYNSQHLNKKGATLFSKTFALKLKKYMDKL